jgi:formate-dependent nitrite reductase membrane component NrfD
MTTTRELLYGIVIGLTVLELFLGKPWELWGAVIILVSADPGSHPNKWNVLLAALMALALVLFNFHVFPNEGIAILFGGACALLSIVNRYIHRHDAAPHPL